MRQSALAAAVIAIGSGTLLGCAQGPDATSPATPATPAVALRYVALGDSYTIGTSVGEAERWPEQLVATLAGTVELELVGNLGVNGASSDDLIRNQLPRLEALQPVFVTVLIGVNDVVRGVPANDYTANVEQILDAVLVLLSPDRIVVVSTPDYTRTPMGAAFGDPQQQRAAISQFNGIMSSLADERGIAIVDISSAADAVGSNPALVAADGLHPSGAQYAAWVELIAPVVAAALQAR